MHRRVDDPALEAAVPVDVVDQAEIKKKLQWTIMYVSSTYLSLFMANKSLIKQLLSQVVE